MASFVIGDVHGCYRTLVSLLGVLGYRSGVDTIWMVGDLVNRGPDSLAVTRWAIDQVNVDTVLGNHELLLLACAWGVAKPREHDNLDSFLEAKDCFRLVDWLRRRPLLAEQEDHMIVHGGLLPQWTLGTAKALAREVENNLRSPGAADFLKRILNDREWKQEQDLRGEERARAAARVFTSLRTCRPDGVPCFRFTGPPEEAPRSYRPWYKLRKDDHCKILFGHWAALGHRRFPGYEGLDSGCGWGGELTALRLEDGAVFQAENLDFG